MNRAYLEEFEEQDGYLNFASIGPASKSARRTACDLHDTVAAGLGSADVFVSGGQKWLRAGFSTGVMAVSARALDRLAPTLSGWWSVEDNHEFEIPLPHPVLSTADRFLEGSPNLPGAFAAAAALRVVEDFGDALRAQVRNA